MLPFGLEIRDLGFIVCSSTTRLRERYSSSVPPAFLQVIQRLFGEQVERTQRDRTHVICCLVLQRLARFVPMLTIRRGRVIRNQVAPAGINETSLNF